MTIFIAFLRGINVAGREKILMADLKELFISIGFSEVVTYIQSGNVLFRSEEKNILKIRRLVENRIKNEYRY